MFFSGVHKQRWMGILCIDSIPFWDLPPGFYLGQRQCRESSLRWAMTSSCYLKVWNSVRGFMIIFTVKRGVFWGYPPLTQPIWFLLARKKTSMVIRRGKYSRLKMDSTNSKANDLWKQQGTCALAPPGRCLNFPLLGWLIPPFNNHFK